MTAWGSVEVAVQAIRLGARDFVEKPWDNDRLLSILRNQVALSRALRRGLRLEAENATLLTREAPDLIATAPAMQPVLELIARVGPSDANVLITGEHGSGKEVVARRLHAVSARAERPLITVNVGGLPDGVFASELFGHVKGAFTDAKGDRVGRFEMADGGTLFLDEIANVPFEQQAKLLRTLETGELERVGSSKTRMVDARIISATNADLAFDVAQGRFREDLLFRLNTVEIRLPPLRERPEDIPLLAHHFLGRYAQKYRQKSGRIRRRRHHRPAAPPVARQRARAGARRRTRRPDGRPTTPSRPTTSVSWRSGGRRHHPRRDEPRRPGEDLRPEGHAAV